MNFDLGQAPGSSADDVVIPELSEQILDDLFAAATDVLKLQPWKKLCDTDWFGIRDPDSGDTHVVAIMGASRQLFSLNVYLPEEGIRFWNEFIRTGVPDPHWGMRDMRMVSCEFIGWNEDDMDETDMERDHLHGDDSVFVDGLDSFLFRSTQPGCINWHLEDDEAVKLLDGMRLLPVFLPQFGFLSMKCGDTDFDDALPKIPVFVLRENGCRENPADWEVTIERFPQAAPEPDFLPDELFSARVRGFTVKSEETWEIASDYLEPPVVFEGRPRWMTLTVAASLGSGMAFGVKLHPAAEPKENALRKSFLAAVEAAGYVPATLCVRSGIAKRTFTEIPGVTVRVEEDLPLFDAISDQLRDELALGPEANPMSDITPEASAAIKEVLGRHPSPENMSPVEVQAMLDELMKIEGAEILMDRAAKLSGAEEQNPPPPASSGKR